MNFLIVDDDEAVRSMLTEIIEDYDLGEVVGEASNGSMIDEQFLSYKDVDILIIDLLMPQKDGLQAIMDLHGSFHGKIIMVSQVENKEIIGKAYSLGVQYYITKPINRLEVIGVIEKVLEHIRLEKSIMDIQKALNILDYSKSKQRDEKIEHEKKLISSGQFILKELGILGESGSKDLLDTLTFLNQYAEEFEHTFPPLKDIFSAVAAKKLGVLSDSQDVIKESKAAEQRIRRAIFQGVSHIASIGLTDYSNPKFEEYSSKFYDFTEIRTAINEFKKNGKLSMSSVTINIKKFIKMFFFEAKNL